MWLHIHFQKANSINDIILVYQIHKKITVTSRMNEPFIKINKCRIMSDHIIKT